jgi:serine/threonine protein kinase
MSNLIGKSLGRYHILEPLGEGGMAVVYKAYDTRLETDVAVKVIRTENILPSVLERSLKRFEREAKSLARLTHPNIVKVTDYGEFEGKPYLVMPYLPGGTLKDRIKQGQIPWQEAVRLILPIAQALEYAHEHNIIHRDVKPSNILLTEKGQPMLTDFGVAKLFDMDATADLTGTGMGVGTPEYMAPEQWQGQVSAQTDVYALGVVLYEMVTGRRPYTAETPAALLIKQTNDPLPRPGSFAPGLPDQVEKIILRALAKKVENRYPTMAEFAAALARSIGGKTIAEAQPPMRVVREMATVQEVASEPTIPIHETSRPHEKKLTRLFWLIGGSVIVFIAILTGVLKGSSITPPPTQILTLSKTAPATFLPDSTYTKTATFSPTPGHVTRTLTPVGDVSLGKVLFKEDFEDGMPTGFRNFNGLWRVIQDGTGNWVYEVNDDSKEEWYSVMFGSVWKDFVVEYRIKIISFKNWINIGAQLCFRVKNSESLGSAQYNLMFVPYGGGLWLGYGDDMANDYRMPAAKDFDIKTDMWYSVKIEAIGVRIRVFVNEEQELEVYDSGLKSGSMGLRVGPGMVVQYDDIVVTEVNK